MFNPANTAHFTLAIDGLEHDLQVLAFEGREALNQPYRFDITLVSEQPDLDLESLLHRRAFLAFTPQGEGVHGMLQRVEQGESGHRLTRYHVTLQPQLSYLALRHNQRIFQHLTVADIIATVLEEHGITSNDYRFQLGSLYPERTYCVQYDESDLHFIQRLCEEEGIHYHFEHSAAGHLLVFGDDQTSFRKLGQPTVYLPDSGMTADEPVIKHFAVRVASRTRRVTRRDYDFEKPRLLMEAAFSPNDERREPDLEDYDYPGAFTERPRGKHLSQRIQERHRADYQQGQGDSDQPRLVTGHLLEISDHPRKEWNDLWLLTEVLHYGKQAQVLEENGDVRNADSQDFEQGYRNHFLVTPWQVPYRPPFVHRKPQVLGSQTAVVTGPQGEEIHCDEYGRIKVQFHWDREGQANEHTSCWLRVASNWAGDRYGGIAIPRIGMEVLVTFLEGDPDQPLVTGCLFHKEHLVPYDLPANKTRSVFKTLSSPGGGGYNELRIEDKKGQEQIYLHAQRDWDENIEHDQRIRIGNERHDTVEANSHTEIRGEEHRLTLKDRKTEVKLSDHLKVADTQHVKLGSGQFVEAGNEIHYYAGNKLVVDAGLELTASAGGSFLKLDPSGITLSGAQIKLNSGGSPGKGRGLQLLTPLTPAMAAKALAGELLDLPQANSLTKPELFTAEELADVPLEEEEEEVEIEEPAQQAITLRIGVFFDGTGNNKNNTETVRQCFSPDLDMTDVAEAVREHCAKYGYDGEGSSPDNSYGNDLSNVARLYDLYLDDVAYDGDKSGVKSVKVYVDGIGTLSGERDSLFSQATGLGEMGVAARVEESGGLIGRRIKKFIGDNPGVVVRSIEFDVFGFSRGAAAARHFINELVSGEGSKVVASIKAAATAVKDDFSWVFNSGYAVNFVGIFDTVAAIANPFLGDVSGANANNPGVDIRLREGCAKKVVHLVARDEVRKNFALNSAGQDILVPGVHSDVGGGYLPIAQEKLFLSRPLSNQLPRNTPDIYVPAYREAVRNLLVWQRKGVVSAGLDKQSLQVVTWRKELGSTSKRDSNRDVDIYAAVAINRKVSGRLSLVYLRIMRDLAESQGVPFSPLDDGDQALALPQELRDIHRKLNSYVLNGGVGPALSYDEEALLRMRYIHNSAHWNAAKGFNESDLGVVFVNRPAQEGKRVVHPNE